MARPFPLRLWEGRDNEEQTRRTTLYVWMASTKTVRVSWNYAWAAPTCDPLARSPKLIEQIFESYLPENWALVVQGLSVIVPELHGSRTCRIVVLEANPERESHLKRWASGKIDNTRAVGQTQVSMDEEAEEGEPDESRENLGKEDPSEGDEDEGTDGDEEDVADWDSDDDDDTEGSGAYEDENSEGGQNVVDSEADEAEEHKESPSRSNEDGNGGDAREGSDSEVDSPLQIRRTERGRGSREPVLRGVLVLGKGKGTMADVRRSLSGGQSMHPARLVRRSMPAPLEPQHSIAASLVAVENLLQMPIRVTRDAQLVARKRLVPPGQSGSPV